MTKDELLAGTAFVKKLQLVSFLGLTLGVLIIFVKNQSGLSWLIYLLTPLILISVACGLIGFILRARYMFSRDAYEAELNLLKPKQPWEN